MGKKVARWFGFNPPFIGGQQKALSRQEDIRLIKNDLLQLILTKPGERVHRPRFGSSVKFLLFDPNDNLTAATITAELTALIAAEEPRLMNAEVITTQNRDRYEFEITITAKLTDNPSTDFELEVNLPFSEQTVTQQEIATGSTGPLAGNTGV